MPHSTIDLTSYIRDIPDFPKPGILFRDITPLLAAPEALSESIRLLADHYSSAEIDVIVAAEARGFIFASPLAVALNVGFVPIRKPGKLPFETDAFHYELEYGTDTLEMHVDGVTEGQNVLVVDDIFDTGKTLQAVLKCIQQMQPKSVASAVLLHKQGRQRVDFEPDFVAFHIPDEFVVGYGLDYQDHYRNLPFLAVLETSEISAELT